MNGQMSELCLIVILFKSACDRLFIYSKCLPKCHVLDHVSVPFNFYSNTACIQNIRLQHACMLCVNGMGASVMHSFNAVSTV